MSRASDILICAPTSDRAKSKSKVIATDLADTIISSVADAQSPDPQPPSGHIFAITLI